MNTIVVTSIFVYVTIKLIVLNNASTVHEIGPNPEYTELQITKLADGGALNSTFQSVMVRSKIECAALCARSSNCWALSLSKVTHRNYLCQLSAGISWHLDASGGIVYKSNGPPTIETTTHAGAITTAITTQVPAITTRAPAITTQAPAITARAPAITARVPAITTQAPAITTQVPAITTRAPATTTQAPVITTPTPITTTPPQVITTPAPITTTPPQVITTQANAITTLPSEITTDLSCANRPANPAHIPQGNCNQNCVRIDVHNSAGTHADLVYLRFNGHTDVIQQLVNGGEWSNEDLEAGARLYARVKDSSDPEIYFAIIHNGFNTNCYADLLDGTNVINIISL